MRLDTPSVSPEGLRSYQALRSEAITVVSDRFYSTYADDYAQFGRRGRDACREDLSFHLEFLRPVLEFGLVQPMVDYLHWLASVLAARDVPVEHLALSLDWLGEFFAAAMVGDDAARVVAALREVKVRYTSTGNIEPAIYAALPQPWAECATFEGALLRGDRGLADALVDRRFAEGHDLIAVELHLIQPALYGIGRQWQNNQVTVAQEHLATAIAQSLMTRGLLQSSIPPSNGKKVLLACVDGNTHVVGLQMVADAFQLAGWDVQYLGASVPAKALIDQVRGWKPDLLGLSVSFAQQLRAVREIIVRLEQGLGSDRPPVIVGGLAINQFNRLVAGLGADGWSADAGAAVATASRLAA